MDQPAQELHLGRQQVVSVPRIERSAMVETDDLMDKLADRAKEAKDHAHASASTTKERLQSQVSEARASADKTTQQLKQKASSSRNEASQRWSEARQNWSDHVAEIREKIDAEKAERDAGRAQRRAERAEDSAVEAVDFAFLAIEEAEYAVLDAAWRARKPRSWCRPDSIQAPGRGVASSPARVASPTRCDSDRVQALAVG
jgi:hypothetical protein